MRPVRPYPALDSGPSDEFRAPRPLRTARLLLAPVLLPATLWLSGLFPGAAALGFSVFLAFFALLQIGLAAYGLRRSCSLGDALLRAYPGLPPVSMLAAWRSAELTSPRNRRALRRLVCQLRKRALLEETVTLLRRLELRLETLTEPVSPFGMLELHALVAHELSSRSFPERADGVLAALTQALAGLEPA